MRPSGCARSGSAESISWKCRCGAVEFPAVELAAAYKSDMAKRKVESAPEIAADERQRARWLEAQPEVKAELEKRARRRRV
jgi:hypothetical protein